MLLKNTLLSGGSVPGGNIVGLGTDLGNPGANSATILAKLISAMIGLLTVIGAIYFLFNLVTGAISIISAGGDKGAYEEARKKITQSIIGMIVVIAAYFIMDLVATLLGIPTILDLSQIATF